MRSLPTKIAMTLTSAVALILLAVTPVAAEHGTSGSGDSSGSGRDTTTASSTTTTGTTSTTKTETENEQGVEPNETEVNDKVQTFRTDALQTLQQERKTGQEHSTADRQTACKAHQTEINNKIANFSKQAQNHLDVFNKVFARVQAFQTSKNVTVTNWDSLVATATTDQTAATNAVAALKTLSVTIDCTSTDPAASVGTVKTAVDNARTTLQTFHTAIKAMIVALGNALDASSSTTTTTTGGDQ